MIAGLFLNPGFLLVALALVSVPIIIHLINRMRFKRVRWAAMEFLLKAQKRTRRRLIIEQLLLLALRCLLIGLVGLLVSRFVGCGDSNAGGKPNLHIALLDDTLSMQDIVKGPDGVARSCMDVAKQDFLVKKIAKGLSQSKTNDQLMIIQLSKVNDPGYEPKIYQNLNDTGKMKALVSDINEIEASFLHVPMLDGVKFAQKIIGDKSENRATLHVLSDYRDIDWSGKAGEATYKELLDLVRNNKDIRIRPIDTVLPARGGNQGGFPPSNDNVGITDIRPSTRIVGHKMPVHFIVDFANYSGKPVEVHLTARDENTGQDMLQVSFDMQDAKEDKTRIRLPPGLSSATFDYGDIRHGFFFETMKPGQTKFAHISVRMTDAAKQPLPNDGLLADNIRHTVVEVRDKVPILVIDGAGSQGREEGKDSYILERSLSSITGASYVVEFGDIIAKSNTNAAKALEVADLSKYPTIFLANVQQLTLKQLANLENFVKEGGGVAFYMGPLVNVPYYNKSLYNGGKGIFPAPLRSQFPPAGEKELKDKDSDTYQMITRDEKFPKGQLPIFGKIFEEPSQREPLRNLPIRRYFKVDRALWKQDPGRVHEIATLPNEGDAVVFGEQVAAITQQGQALREIYVKGEYAKYRKRLEDGLRLIEDKVRAGSEAKAYHLANQIEALMNEPDMATFFDNGDPNVQTLRRQLNDLREQVYYGDPFIITQRFGKGNVVAIMSTVGKDWNDWCGGCTGSVVFMPFIWEMQNHLSSPGADANLLVGANLDFAFDADAFKGANLKLVRHTMIASEGKPAAPDKKAELFGKPGADGRIVFTMRKHDLPGRYEYKLYDDNEPDKLLGFYSHTFNVDTQREGQLQRISTEEMERELVSKANEIAKSKDAVKFVAPGMPDDMLVAKQNDFSESPWLFLILLLVLVAEQALAVHLSFHLKNAEDLPTGVRA